MPTTLENTLIRFNDGTTQSTAATTPPAASTSVAGIVQLSTATDSTSTTLAATASAVKAAYDLANSKPSSIVPSNKGVGEVIIAHANITSDISAGGTIAGSALYYATSANVTLQALSSTSSTFPTAGLTALSGTWRAICYVRGRYNNSTTYYWYAGLFIRIS